jgi:hypothetical protein
VAETVIEIHPVANPTVLELAVVAGPTGPQGPTGPAGAETNSYEFIQSTPSATWSALIPPAIGRRPTVQAYLDGEPVFVPWTISGGYVLVSWPAPVAGSLVIT